MHSSLMSVGNIIYVMSDRNYYHLYYYGME
jgi:hypothetical protein